MTEVTYQIMVQERGSDRVTTLCHVKSNPYDIADAAREKMLNIEDGFGRRVDVPRYDRVRVVKHHV